MNRLSSLLLFAVLPLAVTTACSSSSDDGSADDADLGKNPITGIAAAKLVIDTGQYTDGPVWSVKEQVLYFTVPIGDKDNPGLYRVKPDGSAMKVRGADAAAGAQPIGNAVDTNGELITVEAKRITRGEGATPIATGFASDKGAGTFDTLNDAVVLKSGIMYVTDPGYFANPPPMANRIYRVMPDGNVAVAESFENVPRPNGLALSPDQKILYVGFERPAAGTKPYIEKYNLKDDGTLAEHSHFVELDMDSSPDGVEVDKAGNVYIANKAGVSVFTPAGKRIGNIAIPDQPTGMAFGGTDFKTLYVTTMGTKIFSLKLNVPGINQ